MRFSTLWSIDHVLYKNWYYVSWKKNVILTFKLSISNSFIIPQTDLLSHNHGMAMNAVFQLGGKVEPLSQSPNRCLELWSHSFSCQFCSKWVMFKNLNKFLEYYIQPWRPKKAKVLLEFTTILKSVGYLNKWKLVCDLTAASTELLVFTLETKEFCGSG